MKRDSIFYQLFQRSPTLLFELIPNPPENASAYRFDSVAVKEPRFEIDGVFLPPENSTGTVFFSEVQMQRDEQLYERLFAEVFLYFYRNRTQFEDWQIVVIYPSRRTEQRNHHPYRSLLATPQVHRIYLDELGNIRQLPLWVALMVLTTLSETQAPEEARYLLARSQQEDPTQASRAIMDMVVTIISYKFVNLSRKDVETMLGLALKETRVYREIKEEGREEGREEVRLETAGMVLGLINKSLGPIDEDRRTVIEGLPLRLLKDLTLAVLDFSTVDDLSRWLTENAADDAASQSNNQ